jgi:hypothetical protein
MHHGQRGRPRGYVAHRRTVNGEPLIVISGRPISALLPLLCERDTTGRDDYIPVNGQATEAYRTGSDPRSPSPGGQAPVAAGRPDEPESAAAARVRGSGSAVPRSPVIRAFDIATDIHRAGSTAPAGLRLGDANALAELTCFYRELRLGMDHAEHMRCDRPQRPTVLGQ